MRVTMTKSMPGSEDGIRVRRYEQDETYELSDALARSFIGSKCARPAPEPEPKTGANDGGKKAAGPSENK